MEGSGPGGLNTPQSGGSLHSQITLICQRIPFPDKPNHEASILPINCTGGSRQYVSEIIEPTTSGTLVFMNG